MRKIKEILFVVLLALLVTGCEKEQLNDIEQDVEVKQGSSQSEPITSVDVSSIIDDEEKKSPDYETSSADDTEESDASMMSDEEKNDYNTATKQIIEENKEIIVEEDEREEENYKQAVDFILEENQEMISRFLKEFPIEDNEKAFLVDYFDFDDDGQKEIILTKSFLQVFNRINYHYVFHASGEKMFEFFSVGSVEFYRNKENRKLYIFSQAHFGSPLNLYLYGEMSLDTMLNVELKFAEWDTRDGRARTYGEAEGYYIFKDFSKEEERKMGESFAQLLEVLDSKKALEDKDEFECYKAVFAELEGCEEYETAGCFMNSEEGIVWIRTGEPLGEERGIIVWD